MPSAMSSAVAILYDRAATRPGEYFAAHFGNETRPMGFGPSNRHAASVAGSDRYFSTQTVPGLVTTSFRPGLARTYL